jgi:hypothetical protein
MSLWKTWSDVWDKIVVEDGLTRTWPQWTMHRRRASGSLDVEELYVIEKSKWMFNPRNQAYYEESYITKCQSLLNKKMKWHGYQKWKLIIRVEYSKSHPRIVNAKARSNSQPSWSQKEEKWQQSIWCKLKLKKLFFIFPEYRNIVLLRGGVDEVKITKSSLFHPSKIETSSQTAGQCPASLEDQPQFKKHSQKLLIGQCCS